MAEEGLGKRPDRTGWGSGAGADLEGEGCL